MKTVDLVKKYRHIFNTDYTQDANCTAAWLFQEGSGTTVADSSANSNTLTFKASGEPAWSTSSPPKAYITSYAVFDGTDDYATAADDNTLDIASSFTLTQWIRPDFAQDAANPEYGFTISKGANYYLAFNRYIDDWRFRANWSGMGDCDTVGLTWSASSWHTIQASFSIGTDPDAIVYWDGVQAGTVSGAYGNPSGVANDLFLGAQTASACRFPGGIAETAIFTRELDSTELNEIIDNGLQGSTPAAGNIKAICGIPWANVKKVSGIAKANIKKIAGISAQ